MSNLKIIRSQREDIDSIFGMYDIAVNYQRKVFDKYWNPFDRAMVEKEIEEGRQWRILIDDDLACVFAVAYKDPIIWKGRDKDPAIYLHRIVTHDAYRGRSLINKIIDWSRIHAHHHHKRYIRMDTWGDNIKLKEYYIKCGFTYLELQKITDASQLPSHYIGLSLSLFEIDIDKSPSTV